MESDSKQACINNIKHAALQVCFVTYIKQFQKSQQRYQVYDKFIQELQYQSKKPKRAEQVQK